jgi:glucan 1,3-beta-glucosidase
MHSSYGVFVALLLKLADAAADVSTVTVTICTEDYLFTSTTYTSSAGGDRTAEEHYAVGSFAAGDWLSSSTSIPTNFHSASTSTTVGSYKYYSASTTSTTSLAKTSSSPSPNKILTAGEYTDWTVYVANGVNLGGWFELELANNPDFFAAHAPDAVDEWNLCKILGNQCGRILEERYSTFITTGEIDKLASVGTLLRSCYSRLSTHLQLTGVDTLRIPTQYASWVLFPGSELYHGNQRTYLQAITKYAIETYGMRIIIDLHSLPGGVNGFDEKFGNTGLWFFNEIHLEYSYKTVEAVMAFIQASGNPWAFTIAVINEPSDNVAAFATTNGLTTEGTAWVVKYYNGALSIVQSVNGKVPVMISDAFLGEGHWSSYFEKSTNLVIDSHIYFFIQDGIYPQWANYSICGQASVVAGDGKFPVFIGEWSLALSSNNTLSAREELFNIQIYAWSKYAHGSAFWSVNHTGTGAIVGEGEFQDYWSYLRLINQGVIHAPDPLAVYCT